MHPELLKALQTGDIKTLESLIASGVDIKQKDANGNTALLVAAAHGQIPMLEHLLAKKYATVTEKNNFGNTALLLAAAYGQIPMLEHLLAKKYATVTEKNNAGSTALLLAAANGEIPMLEHLLAKKYATATEKNNGGNTALLVAAANGQIPMLEHLLAKKYATVTEKNNNGNTALLMAAANGQIPMLEHLLAKKYATVTEKNNFGNTALLLAAANGLIPMLEHLLAMPEVSIQECNTDEGDNVLSFPAWYGESAAMAYLLKRGAYIDLLLNDGRSPVQVIQAHSNKTALPLLQAAETLIQVATGKGASASAEALVKILGENLNARRVYDGNTALHLAIIHKNLPLIKLLLENDADVTMPNKEQVTPFQLLQRVHVNDPYILAVSHIQNIGQIAKNLDLQQKSSAKPASLEVKQRHESITLDAGDEKGGKERLEIAGAGLPNQNTTLLKQCAASIEAIQSNIEKMPMANENQRKEKQGLCYKVGELLANQLSAIYNPVAAYGFLSQITQELPKFPEAQGLMAELLISGNIIFQNDGLETEPTPTSVSAAMGLDVSTEDAGCRAQRQKTIIKHLLQGSSKHEDAIGKYIAEYTLGAAKSVAGLANVKGKDVDSQMALIEALRERELEIKLLQEKMQAKEIESSGMQEKLAQFAMMQEKLKQFELMESENRRLKQEITSLRNQGLDKDAPASSSPAKPRA